jgi:hypothetical protein
MLGWATGAFFLAREVAMRTLTSCLKVLLGTAAVALLTACSAGSRPLALPIGSSETMPDQMSPSSLMINARSTALLYVANTSNGTVNVDKQTGTNQKPISRITGPPTDSGLFVDRAKNLYICSYGHGSQTGYVAVFAKG